MYTVTLEGRGDLGEWREAARPLLQAGVDPDKVVWQTPDATGGLFADDPQNVLPPSVQGKAISVPPDFLKLAGAVVCHSDPRRFALLYRLLARLARDRYTLAMAADVDVVKARQMAKSVGRDYHKMTAFVRFKELPLPPGTAGRRRFVAWFEPDHFIVERRTLLPAPVQRHGLAYRDAQGIGVLGWRDVAHDDRACGEAASQGRDG